MPVFRAGALAALAVALAAGEGGVAARLADVEDTLGTYLLLAAGTFPTSEFAPIVGGFAAYEGALRLVPVVASVVFGGWVATSVLYWLGRRHWGWLRRRSRAVRTTGTVALRVVRRNPLRAAFLVRFLLGARVLLPIACGAAGVPAPAYLALSFAGSVAWTLVYVAVGAVAGEAAEQVLAHIEQLETILIVGGTMVVLALVVWWRRRQARRAARRSRRARGERPSPPGGGASPPGAAPTG